MALLGLGISRLSIFCAEFLICSLCRLSYVRVSMSVGLFSGCIRDALSPDPVEVLCYE